MMCARSLTEIASLDFGILTLGSSRPTQARKRYALHAGGMIGYMTGAMTGVISAFSWIRNGAILCHVSSTAW